MNQKLASIILMASLASCTICHTYKPGEVLPANATRNGDKICAPDNPVNVFFKVLALPLVLPVLAVMAVGSMNDNCVGEWYYTNNGKVCVGNRSAIYRQY